MRATVPQRIAPRVEQGPTFCGAEIFDTIANLRLQGKRCLPINTNASGELGTKGELIFD
jgi:hypothetical protein